MKAGRRVVSLDSQLHWGAALAQAVWGRKQGRRRAQIIQIQWNQVHWDFCSSDELWKNCRQRRNTVTFASPNNNSHAEDGLEWERLVGRPLVEVGGTCPGERWLRQRPGRWNEGPGIPHLKSQIKLNISEPKFLMVASKAKIKCNYGWDGRYPGKWVSSGEMPFCLLLVILLAESVAGRECPSFHNSPAKGWRNYAGKPEGWEPRLVYLNDCSRVSSLEESWEANLVGILYISLTRWRCCLFFVLPVMRRHSSPELPILLLKSLSAEHQPSVPFLPRLWPENAIFLKEMGLKNPCMKMPALTKAPLKQTIVLIWNWFSFFSHSRPSSISSFVSDRDSNMVELKKDFCRNRALGIR